MLTILHPSKVVCNVFSDLAAEIKASWTGQRREMQIYMFKGEVYRHRFPVWFRT